MADSGRTQHRRTAPTGQRLFPIRAVVLGAMLPAFLYAMGMGAVLPILASFSVERGATLALAAVIVAAAQIGQMLASLPAGVLVARIGERRSMMIAGGAAAVSFAAAALLPSLMTLAVSIFLVGAAGTVFQLARHSYLAAVTPAEHRARVLSTLAGVNRIGRFIGPFLGAAVAWSGDLRWVFLIAVVTATSAAITAGLAQTEEQQPEDAQGAVGKKPSTRVFHVIRDHRRVLGTLGVAVALVGMLRGAKRHIIPLWGEAIGLDPAMIALIYGITNGIDMLLFYPAGKVMDRMGRLWVAVPSLTGLGIAMALVPLTGSALTLGAAGVFLGLVNGMGAGIMMTIAADVAPSYARPQFLSAWRLLSNTGSAAGPLLLATAAAAGSLAVGLWIAAALGPAASAALCRWLPQYSDHANHRRRS
ncbi:MFS transporter [Nesterenkonia sp. MY13]|uniref:MFS transporter n=1 Tax=Nesterenkonia sedimenti TaxID=1463632 RepID=A0A7X8YD36_9MICC|nr:MFS transporter [Nesterenkonia sedimenti]NLS09040.1 MFS transporter [Nesterenkonia sedimenti]